MMALWLILICVGVVSADVPELRGWSRSRRRAG